VADLPNAIEEAFDLKTEQIHRWEEDLIHVAIMEKQIRIENHGVNAAADEGIQLVDVLRVVLVGVAVSKDIPGNALRRQPGINFEGEIPDGRNIRVKVSWDQGYAVITVHTI
jgi:hypothetical protein